MSFEDFMDDLPSIIVAMLGLYLALLGHQ